MVTSLDITWPALSQLVPRLLPGTWDISYPSSTISNVMVFDRLILSVVNNITKRKVMTSSKIIILLPVPSMTQASFWNFKMFMSKYKISCQPQWQPWYVGEGRDFIGEVLQLDISISNLIALITEGCSPFLPLARGRVYANFKTFLHFNITNFFAKAVNGSLPVILWALKYFELINKSYLVLWVEMGLKRDK